jgi:hypothetical protein
MGQGVIKARYPNLQGRDWLRTISPEDRQAFWRAGFAASDYGRMGGRARADTAKRDHRGRFVKESK